MGINLDTLMVNISEKVKICLPLFGDLRLGDWPLVPCVATCFFFFLLPVTLTSSAVSSSVDLVDIGGNLRFDMIFVFLGSLNSGSVLLCFPCTEELQSKNRNVPILRY